jgi:non-heme chloroperoxidase
MRYIVALLSLLLIGASAPADLSGTWEGTMNGPTGQIRRIMVITKSNGTYDVTIHSIDETDVPIVTRNVRVDGSNLTMTFDMNTDPWLNYHRVYHATLNASGTAMDGTWSIIHGPSLKLAMNYHRVAHASWPILVPKITMVEVQPGVKVEAFDWGGAGRPVLLLAGLGNTGHDVYIKIIPDLKAHYHVYSMTRRGFGDSSKPAPTVANYSVGRLGDDVLAVMHALNIKRPVLIGHSIAGEELTDIATRYPQKVAGLVYLDAGYWYAYDPGLPNPFAVLKTPGPGFPPMPSVGVAVLKGMQSFRGPIDVPILAIFAHPHDTVRMAKTASDKAREAKNNADQTRQIDGFRRGLPNAKVIVIPYADHFVFLSNTAEVQRDIIAFIAKLPA